MHRPGDIIDERYLLVKLVGLRAGAEMWEAEHEVVGRKVTLKFMSGTFESNPGLQTLIVREARAASEIRHPTAVEVYDVGATPTGQAYLVAEPLRGETLADLLSRRRPLRPADACHIAREILEGLEAAHRVGIVHGNLRPDMIVLRSHASGQLAVKILEFRVVVSDAPPAAEESTRETELSEPSVPPVDSSVARIAANGSLRARDGFAHRAPEQADDREADPASDLFAVSVMLWEMLTGQSANEVTGPLLPTGIASSEDETPGEPGTIPSALARVLRRGLAREPADRFRSAHEMIEAIKPFAPDAPSKVVLRESMTPLLSREARHSWAMDRLERAVMGADASSRAASPSVGPLPTPPTRDNVVVIESARRLSSRPPATAGGGTSAGAHRRDSAPPQDPRMGINSRAHRESIADTRPDGLIGLLRVPPPPRTPRGVPPFHSAPSAPAFGLRGRTRRGFRGGRSRRRTVTQVPPGYVRWTTALFLVGALFAGALLAHWLRL